MFKLNSENCSKGDKFLHRGHMVTVKSISNNIITVVDKFGKEHKIKQHESVFKNNYCENAIKSEKERIANREKKIEELKQLESSLKSKIKKWKSQIRALLAKGKKENLSGAQRIDLEKLQKNCNYANYDLTSAGNSVFSLLMDNFSSYLDVGKLENQNALIEHMSKGLNLPC